MTIITDEEYEQAVEGEKLPPGLKRDINGDVYEEWTGDYLERCEKCREYGLFDHGLCDDCLAELQAIADKL